MLTRRLRQILFKLLARFAHDTRSASRYFKITPAQHDIKEIRVLGLSIHLLKLASFKITTSFRTLATKMCNSYVCKFDRAHERMNLIQPKQGWQLVSGAGFITCCWCVALSDCVGQRVESWDFFSLTRRVLGYIFFRKLWFQKIFPRLRVFFPH